MNNHHGGLVDPAAVTDDHPLAWSDVFVHSVMNEGSLLSDHDLQ